MYLASFLHTLFLITNHLILIKFTDKLDYLSLFLASLPRSENVLTLEGNFLRLDGSNS